jgi:hypothetical protein
MLQPIFVEWLAFAPFNEGPTRGYQFGGLEPTEVCWLAIPLPPAVPNYYRFTPNLTRQDGSAFDKPAAQFGL